MQLQLCLDTSFLLLGASGVVTKLFVNNYREQAIMELVREREEISLVQ